MPSIEAGDAADTKRLELLGSIAARSIRHGLEHGRPLSVQPGEVPAALEQTGASFVTLKQQGALRGCIGSLEWRRPLAEDVAENAFAAAFRDPRFPPLRPDELAATSVEVSVLSRPEPIEFADERELLSILRPGRDGVVLERDGCRATYLPSVWAMLPDARAFLAELKKKAGIPAEVPLGEITVLRYTTAHSEPRPLDGG